MAKSTESELSLQKGSYLIYDYCCNVCEENGAYNKEAQFFCEQCAKCYCDKCVVLHNQLFIKHSLTGRKEQHKWTVTKATVDALVKCPEHNNEIVKSFCKNHQQLLCHDCLLTKHRQCSDVVTIVDKVNDLQEKGQFNKAVRNIDTLQGMLSRTINVLENDIQSLQETYKKILDDIRTLHRKLSEALKQLKTDTIKELDALMAAIKTSIESDTEQCIKLQTKMQCFQDKIKSLEDHCEAMSFIMYTKSLDLASETDTFLKHMKTHNKVNMTFTPDTTITQTLYTRSGLGKLERLCKVAHPPRKEDTDSIEIDYGTCYDIFDETDKIQEV